MTIKHMNKNISAEKAQVVTNITSSPNGLLVTKTNLHDEANVSDAIDLTGTKLHLMILNSNNDLDLLADCDTDNKLETLNNQFESEYQISFDSLAQLNDYIQSKMFLVEDSTSKEEDNIYNEYIWINGGFELIGTTRIDLTNYIQKSNGTNLLLTDGTNIAQSTFAQATALTSKENTSNKVKSTSGWSSTLTDDHYPSEKLVKSSLDDKVDKENGKGLFSGSYGDLSNKPSYTATVTSSTTGAYKMGSINISGSSVDIYGKDTHQSISGKEDTSNKVTTMSSSSTDTQYPSAKAVYDALPKTTKTLTVTYTNGTTEDIEFYIR